MRLWTAFGLAAMANPVGFLFAFRWLTWGLAVGLVLSDSASDVNLRYEPVLLIYAALQLAAGTIYAVYFSPELSRARPAPSDEKPPADLIVAGIADIVSSLGIIYFSGGWGSPFWHLAVTSIMVPCFLLSTRWGMAVVTAYAVAYVLIVGIAGDGLDFATSQGQRLFFVGNLTTAYLIAIVVGYIGALFRSLQEQRMRTRQALEETETLFRVTESVVRAGTDVEDLLGRVTQDIRATQLFESFAVYLKEPDGLRLASSSVGMEDLPTSLVDGSSAELRTFFSPRPNGEGWQAAVPLLTDDDLIGVMAASSDAQGEDSEKAQQLVEAIAGQIAIGVHNATLAVQRAELAAEHERTRISREIHDGISQSIYMISLRLQSLAELTGARPEGLRERIDQLVVLSREVHEEIQVSLLGKEPASASTKSLTEVFEDDVREFSESGLDVILDVDEREAEVTPSILHCLRRVTHESLANTLKHSEATQASLSLEFQAADVVLTVHDDGVGFDPVHSDGGHGLANMRGRVEELGGSFALESAPGQGTRIVASIPDVRSG